MTKRRTPRQITIGSTRYLWVVRPINAHFVVPRVWAGDRERRDFPLEVRLRYDDLWLNAAEISSLPADQREAGLELAPVTPGSVRAIIEAAVGAGWGPHHPPDGRLFERTLTGDLVAIANPRIPGPDPWPGRGYIR